MVFDHLSFHLLLFQIMAYCYRKRRYAFFLRVFVICGFLCFLKMLVVLKERV